PVATQAPRQVPAAVPMRPNPAPRPMSAVTSTPPASISPVDTGSGASSKRWYQEPAVVVTLMVAVLLVLGFVGLLFIALGQ
ncbi:MAG: hypothetical protein WCA46_21275, partial [Actinocatenispora sp.]